MKQIGNQRDLNLAAKIPPETLFKVNNGSAFDTRCSDYIVHIDESHHRFYKISFKSGYLVTLPKNKEDHLYPYRILECIVCASDGSILGTAELMSRLYQNSLMSID
jgi:hypothetical protein